MEVQIISLAAVTFLKDFLATITRVQYSVSKQPAQLFHIRKLRDITIYWRKAGIEVILSSATGNQLDETWRKSALKLNLECFCSRDENQTRDICDRVSLNSAQVFPRCTSELRWRNLKFLTQSRTNNLLI